MRPCPPVWVGTNSGLNAFDPARGTAVRITRQPGRRDSLPDNWVPDLLVTADGKLWVATPGGAAILTGWDGRDGRTARFEPVADRLGRTPAPVEALIQDAQGLDLARTPAAHQSPDVGVAGAGAGRRLRLPQLLHRQPVADRRRQAAVRLCRGWGGEEFLAVARFVDRGDAPALAEKIRAAIASHPFRLDDGTILERTCSVGFAVYPFLPARPRALGWEEIVGLADLGLYSAKRSGRNGWVGIEAGETDDPAAAVRRFRDDPDSAVRAGEVRMRSTASA
jgi:hypothetical protein